MKKRIIKKTNHRMNIGELQIPNRNLFQASKQITDDQAES